MKSKEASLGSSSKNFINEFEALLDIADRLLGPQGCPWDQKQTFLTLQPYLLEETHELIEALDANDPKKISEELGDVLYALIFIAKLAEQQKIFTFAESMQKVGDKLIRRHPHIFAELELSSSEEVEANWEEIKKKEGKKTPISDIPPTLPALARAQKVIHKLRTQKNRGVEEEAGNDLGQRLWALVKEADDLGIDAESALRRTCLSYEEKFEKHRR